MTTYKIGQVEIYDVKAEDYVNADLFDGLSEKHLLDFENRWKPILDKHLENVRNSCIDSCGNIIRQLLIDELGKLNIQDIGWVWRDKLKRHPQPSTYYKFYVLEYDNVAQGLMSIDLATRRCLLESHSNNHLAYIDYLAVAPWNRPQLYNPQSYRMIGRVMMATAISTSIDAGFKGRIGLHSLPQSENFYNDKCGMICLGNDVHKQNLLYYEMTSEKAYEFISD